MCALLAPAYRRGALAAGAVPIETGVVQSDLGGTLLAAVEVAAERGGRQRSRSSRTRRCAGESAWVDRNAAPCWRRMALIAKGGGAPDGGCACTASVDQLEAVGGLVWAICGAIASSGEGVEAIKRVLTWT